MADLLRLILALLIAFLCWRLSARHPRAMRFCTAISAGVLFGGLAVLAVTGLGRQDWGWPPSVHRWAGHGLVIQAWLVLPIAVGVILQQQIQKAPFRAVLGIVCCVLTLFLAVLASVTGSLNSLSLPTFAGEETRNRFVILHMYAVPYLLALSLAGWLAVASFPPRSTDRTS